MQKCLCTHCPKIFCFHSKINSAIIAFAFKGIFALNAKRNFAHVTKFKVVLVAKSSFELISEKFLAFTKVLLRLLSKTILRSLPKDILWSLPMKIFYSLPQSLKRLSHSSPKAVLRLLQKYLFVRIKGISALIIQSKFSLVAETNFGMVHSRSLLK